MEMQGLLIGDFLDFYFFLEIDADIVRLYKWF
jgi:hypothetical protein